MTTATKNKPKAARVPARISRNFDGTWNLVVYSCPFCEGRHVYSGGSAEKPQFWPHHASCVGYAAPMLLLVPDGVEFTCQEVF